MGERFGQEDHLPWKARSASIKCSHRHREAADEHSDVPPHRNLGVDLHLGQMRVIILARTVFLDDGDDLFPVPDKDMRNSGANRHVPANLRDHL